jgi:hypothetical protein
MRSTTALVLGLVLAAGSPAWAGMNRNFLVPYYTPCPTATCNPPTRSSSYTFDSIVLSSSQARYTKPGAIALAINVKGLKDAGGAAVTGTLTVKVRSRLTLAGIGTVSDASPLADTVYSVPVNGGNGRAVFRTPPETPASGLIVNTIDSPIVYDPDGKPLAATGVQTKN